MSTAGWFTIATLATVLGLVLLRLNARGMDFAAMRPNRGQAKDRRRWAAQKEWEYLDNDPVLPSRWRYGTIHQGGPGVARNLVSGTMLTEDGRRLVYVFDHEQAGRLSTAVVAVQRRASTGGALELRMPSAPLPDDAGLDLMESVGQRFAFVSDPDLIRPMISPRLVRATDAIDEDVELVWAEDSWVLCTTPLSTPSEYLEELIDQLIEVAGALDATARTGSALESGRVDEPSHEDGSGPELDGR
ncbi:MAG: hypothetical protein ACT4O0_18710 [Pseudonocardia sp.]